MNPLVNAQKPQINQQMIKGIKSYMNTMKMAQNPSQALSELSKNNPQLNEVVQLCQGRNPKDVFVEQCNARGLNPQEVIQLLM